MSLPLNPSPEAIEQINAASKSQSQSLDLGPYYLSELPPELGSLIKLECLNLGTKELKPHAQELNEMLQFRDFGPNPVAKDKIRDLSALGDMPKLRVLGLCGFSGLRKGGLEVLSRLTNLRYLDLEACGDLDALPEVLPESLEVLCLRRCQKLESLPARLPAKLMILDVSECKKLHCGNTLKIGHLAELSELRLDGAGMERLELESLPKLTKITFQECHGLKELSLRSLEQTRSVDASSAMALKSAHFTELQSLDEINLRNCHLLREFRVEDLPRIRAIDLSQCRELPHLDWVKNVPSLKRLSLQQCNELKELPPIKDWPPQLQELFLYECDNLPIASEYLDKASDYTQNVWGKVRLRLATTDFSKRNFCKAIVLGNGKAGKTTFLKALIKGEFTGSLRRTHGIDECSWTTKVGFDDMSSEPEDIDVDFWDFAGQDIYHNTHRQFVRHRSVFVLVWDQFAELKQPSGDRGDRRDVGDYEPFHRLEYWLDHIFSLSPSATILIVRTHVGEDQKIVSTMGQPSSFSPVSNLGELMLESRGLLPERHRKRHGQLQFITCESSVLAGDYAERNELVASSQEERLKIIKEQRQKVEEALCALVKKHLGASRDKRQLPLQLEKIISDVRREQQRLVAAGGPKEVTMDEAVWTFQNFETRLKAVINQHGDAADWDTGTAVEMLHSMGVISHLKAPVDDGKEIVVDQRWLFQRLYLLLESEVDPTNKQTLTARHGGRISRSLLIDRMRRLSRSTGGDREVTAGLQLLEQYGVIVRVGDDEYVAPDFLPQDPPADPDHPGDSPRSSSSKEYRSTYLGREIAKSLIARVLREHPDAACWRWGLRYRDALKRLRCEFAWEPLQEGSFGGRMKVTAWADNDESASLFLAELEAGVLRLLPGWDKHDWDPRDGDIVPGSNPKPGCCPGERRVVNPTLGVAFSGGDECWFNKLIRIAKEAGIRPPIRYDDQPEGVVPVGPDAVTGTIVSSDIVVIVVSNQFLTSEYCLDELHSLVSFGHIVNARAYQLPDKCIVLYAEQFDSRIIKVLSGLTKILDKADPLFKLKKNVEKLWQSRCDKKGPTLQEAMLALNQGRAGYRINGGKKNWERKFRKYCNNICGVPTIESSMDEVS